MYPLGGNFYNVRRNGGGAGLIPTISDYYRFAQCILNRGELDDYQLLGIRTVDLMRINHFTSSLLPVTHAGGPWHAIGLGFSMIMDIAQAA